MAVHSRAVGVAVVAVERAVFVRVLVFLQEDEFESLAHGLALVGGVGGQVADRGEAHDGERGHGDALLRGVVAVAAVEAAVVLDAAVGPLLTEEKLCGARGGFLDLLGGDAFLVVGAGGEENEERREEQRNAGNRRRLAEGFGCEVCGGHEWTGWCGRLPAEAGATFCFCGRDRRGLCSSSRRRCDIPGRLPVAAPR